LSWPSRTYRIAAFRVVAPANQSGPELDHRLMILMAVLHHFYIQLYIQFASCKVPPAQYD
jgi:hypothetical protein